MIEACLKDGGVFQEDIVGVDLCAEMLEIAQDRFPDVTFVEVTPATSILGRKISTMKTRPEPLGPHPHLQYSM